MDDRNLPGRPNGVGQRQHRLQIVYRQIAQLKADPRNPRHHSRKQIKKLARSIQTFGFTVPALVDTEGNVIAGHGRILACHELGWSEIPTILIEGLSEAERRALAIADNRLAQLGTWNERLLAEQLRNLSLVELDFTLDVTGFELGEVDLKIASLEGDLHAKDPADAEPELASGPPVTKPGDLWLLGEQHRVLCRSALDPAALQELMSAERAGMVFTEWHLDVPLHGIWNQANYCAPGRLMYVCADWKHIAEMIAAARELGLQVKDLCVWDTKTIRASDALYDAQHQFILVFQIGSGPVCADLELSRHRHRSNLWRYPSVKSGLGGSAKAKSPPIKPIALVTDAILDGTRSGEIVLDGFLKDGTTVLAAERTIRRCFGMEADPRRVDVIIKRWQRLSRNKVRCAKSGRSFDELSQTVEVSDGT